VHREVIACIVGLVFEGGRGSKRRRGATGEGGGSGRYADSGVEAPARAAAASAARRRASAWPAAWSRRARRGPEGGRPRAPHLDGQANQLGGRVIEEVPRLEPGAAAGQQQPVDCGKPVGGV
jgi:hypothetical protein